jgi:hypothetical protein
VPPARASEPADVTVPARTQTSQTRYEQASHGQSQDHRRNLLLRVAGSFALIVVFALTFELTCRVEDWVMYRMPLASPYRSVEDLIIRDADGMHGRPNAQFQKWIMNDVGTRGPRASLLPASGTVRIITVGASETFGLRESPGHEYPRQLEDSLNARLRRGACPTRADLRVEVLNAAFAGMTLPTIHQDVRNRLARLHPAVVVAYPSPASYLEAERPVAARPDSSPNAGVLGSRAMLHPRAIDRLRDQLKEMLPIAVKSWLRQRETNAARAGVAGRLFSTPPADRLSAFEVDVRQLISGIRAIGSTPVLVTHANAFVGRRTIDADKLIAWEKFFPRTTGATLLAFDSLSRSVELSVAAESGTVVVDAARRLASAPDSAFADYEHFADLGAALMASAIADGVIAAEPLARICAGAQAHVGN